MTTRENRDDAAPTGVAQTVAGRRTVAKGLAWTVPVVAVATAAPAFSASCEAFTFGAGSCKCPGQSTPDHYGYWLTICYNCPPGVNANDTSQVTIQAVTKSNKTPLELTPKPGACNTLPLVVPLNGCSPLLHFTGENSGTFLYIEYTISGNPDSQFFKIQSPPDCGPVLGPDGVTVVVPSRCDTPGSC